MADGLMLASATLGAVALLAPAAGGAQALADPTRPPLELISAAAGVPAAEAAGSAKRLRLESILLSSTRKGAIINGQYVSLGGSYGKAQLVGVSATGVTLKRDQEVEVLQLYAPMDKPAAAPVADSKPTKAVTRP